MKNVYLATILMAAVPWSVGCQLFEPRPPAAVQRDLQALQQAMVGSFSSSAQSAADPDHFYDVTLQVAPIWSGRRDGPWLYVEQALAAKPDQPYRQRVYHLVATADGALESQVYELPDPPQQFAGAWRNPAAFDGLKPEQLALRAGCSVFLRRHPEGGFVGKTAGTGCESSLRGARYATSEVTITDDELRSWDRGFSDQNEQVWGSAEGPYLFRRVGASPAASQPSSTPGTPAP